MQYRKSINYAVSIPIFMFLISKMTFLCFHPNYFTGLSHLHYQWPEYHLCLDLQLDSVLCCCCCCCCFNHVLCFQSLVLFARSFQMLLNTKPPRQNPFNPSSVIALMVTKARYGTLVRQQQYNVKVIF